MVRPYLTRLIIASMAAVLAASSSRAEYVSAKLTGSSIGVIVNPGSNVLINDGSGTAPTMSYKAGLVNWTNMTSGPSSLAGQFGTFCIELTQDVYPNTVYTYNLTNLENAPNPGSPPSGGGGGMGTVKADEIRELWGGYAGSLGTNGVYAAAFQLAIWKIEYDWGGAYYNDLAHGNFRATDSAGAVSLAQTWLTSLTTNEFTRASNLIALSNTQYQDQITTIVPAPRSIYLAAIGCAGLCGFAWRKRFIDRRRALAAVRCR